MIKRVISIFLVVVLLVSLFTVLPLSSSAEELNDVPETIANYSNDNLSVTGTNSLGSMIASEYEEYAEDNKDYGNIIYSVEVEGNVAKVDLRALLDAKLIVSIFDEEGINMYGSGMVDVSPDDGIVYVILDIDTMPPYFYIKAFLLDKATNLPLCKQYENNYYTQSMQEFFAKTTDDFDEDKVLNLDESSEDNFLVYNDDTIIIENYDENTNVVTQVDDKSKEYVIENIDESISCLESGDIFSYDFGDGNLLIIKIKTITINGTTAVILGDELELQEAFDYIKIDTTSYTDDAVVDNSNLEEGISYDGKVADVETPDETSGKSELAPTGWTITDENFEVSDTFKYTFAKDELTNPNQSLRYKLSGSVSLKFSVNVKVFFDIDIFQGNTVEFSFTFKYKLGVNFELELKGKTPPWQLGYFAITPCPGFYISFTPSIVVEGKLTAKLSVSIEGQLGFKFKNGSFDDLYKAPTVNSTLSFEGELFVGLSLEPKIGIVADAATASMEVLAGFKIKGTMKRSDDIHSYGLDSSNDEDEKHLCESCLDGEIFFVCELSFKLSIFNNPDLTWSFDVFKLEQKLGDFYYSFDTNTFGWTKCPNFEYRVAITVLDKDQKPIQGVLINSAETTDEKGIAKIYMRAGDNNITFDKDGKVAERKVYVSKAGRFTFAIDFDNPDAIISGRNVLFRRMVILSGKCGDNAYFKLYNDGVLEISGTGDLYSYIKDHAPWYNYVVREVRIFDGITKIGVKDFYGLSMLTNVKLPNTLTSIDSAAFTGSGITEITIPKSLQSVATSYNYYGNYYYTPFQGCSSLKKMIFEDGIETIPNNMAKDCTDLEQVVLPASVKTIGDFAFQNSGLTSLTLPEGVETLGYQILYGNKGVKELTIPGSVVNFRYSTGTYYSGADRGCLEGSGLEKVIISNGITSIAPMMFLNCRSLKDVSIPSSVETIGFQAFDGCSALVSINIPESVTKIEYRAFEDTGLTGLSLPSNITHVGSRVLNGNTGVKYFFIPKSFSDAGTGERLSSGQSMLYGSAVESVEFENGIETIPSNALKDAVSTTSVIIPGSVKTIGDFAFQNSGLTSLTLPEGVETLGYQILYGNKGVKELTIPGSVVNFRYSTGTYYSGADRGCLEGSGLEKVIISNGITSIAPMMFCNCKSLREVVIPNSVESIGFQAFDGCSALNSISIPVSVTKIEYRAFEDTGLTELNLPSSITHVGSRVLNGNTGVKYLFIPKSFNDAGTGERLSSGQSMLYGSAVESVEYENGIETIPSNALKDAASTTSVIIPASVKTIGDFAFQNSGLTSLTLPEGVETLGYHFLKGNTGVKELTIPGTVTNMRITTATLVSGADRGTLEGSGLEKVVIGDGITSIAPMMFCYCRSLKEVIIPSSVETIDYQAFSGCNSLEQINLPDSITRIDFRAFENTGLTELKLPSNLTYLGSRVLNGSNGVKYLFLPKTFNNAGTGEKFGYGYTMLYGSSVETVEFENGIEAIPSNTFKDAASVTNAIIPISVTRINKNAFSNCSALSDIYYAGTEDSWNSITIESGNTIIDSVAIHCADGKDIIPTGMNETDNS